MEGQEEYRGVLQAVADNIAAAQTADSKSDNKRQCPSYGPESVEMWAVTEMEQETFGFLWSVNGFSVFNNATEVKSSLFRGGDKSAHSWQLKMNPNKMSNDGLEYFAIYLTLTGFGNGDLSNTRKLRARYQISLLDLDGRPAIQAGGPTMNPCEFKRLSTWGHDKFILRSELIASRRLLDEDTLKIHCRVWIEGEAKCQTGAGGAATRGLRDMLTSQSLRLSNDFGNLRGSTNFADASMTTPTKTFMVHRAILAARSKVFAAMFGEPAVVGDAPINVEILNFDDDIVDGMLDYVYTGQTQSLSERAPQLLLIAQKFDICGLTELCENNIVQNLTVDTAAEVLLMAHLSNAKWLKSKVIEFINNNKDGVKQTPGFQRISKTHPVIFVDLYVA